MGLYSHDFITCPWCEADSGCRIDHLYDEAPRNFGPWNCRECRRAISGRVIGPKDVTVTRDSAANKTTRSMALLKLEAVDRTVFFVMDHDRYWSTPEDSDAQNQSHQRYFFEEHSCPTNWLDECVAVIEDGNTDPHGFLTFVRAVDVPNDFDADDDNVWEYLFPEAINPSPPLG